MTRPPLSIIGTKRTLTILGMVVADVYLMLTDAASVNVVMVVDATECPDDESGAVQCFRPIHLQSLAAYETKVQILELQLIAQNLFHKPQKKKSYIKLSI